MRHHGNTPQLRWFKCTVFVPHWLLNVLRLPRTREDIWLRDAGGLLLFLSFMYIGAARPIPLSAQRAARGHRPGRIRGLLGAGSCSREVASSSALASDRGRDVW